MMESSRFFVPVEGDYGYWFAGPHSLCGKEQLGGVAISPASPSGDELAGGVLTRESVREIHRRFGQWIKFWNEEDFK